MNISKILTLGLTAGLLQAVPAFAAGFAPDMLGNVLFTGKITASTGGINGAGTFTELFTGTGLDYTVTTAATGTSLSDPVAFTYAKTGDNTATVTEPASAASPMPLSVAMTFTSATEGSYVTTYNGDSAKTQSGTFTTVSVPFSAPTNNLSTPLINMSTRLTLAANGFAISGFVIGGDTPRKVLLRAVGPGLAQFEGVGTTLADPKMSLWSGTTQVASNDNWDPAGGADTAATKSGAFALTSGSKDAAAVVTLAPGNYTALIQGGTATDAGALLLEIYFVE